MMWHMHAAIGAGAMWLLLPFVPMDVLASITIVMAFCVVEALMPDLDAVESKIKHVKLMGIKPLVLVSRAINRDFGQRGLLHSMRGWATWMVLISPLVLWLGIMPVLALSLGYISHLAGDACTRTGIPCSIHQRNNSIYYLLRCV